MNGVISMLYITQWDPGDADVSVPVAVEENAKWLVEDEISCMDEDQSTGQCDLQDVRFIT